MTIGPIHFDRDFLDAVASGAASSIRTVLGAYWAFAVRALDLAYALSLFGTIGALPSVIKLVVQSSGSPVSSRPGLKLPHRRDLLIAFAASLLCLQGCAHVVIGNPGSPIHRGELNSIRTLGPDGIFTDLSAQSVAHRVHALRGAESLTILAMSGGGADGAFGAGALVGLTRSDSRSQFDVVSGVSAGANFRSASI